jgi:uncharacterized protein (DUF305 family)
MARLTRLQLPIIALIAAVLAIGPAACGDDDEDGGGAGSEASKTEQAFLEGIIPHHESAIEMAEVADRRAQRTEIKKLARAIIASQSDEIAQMERIHERLFGEEITPDPAAHEALGLSVEEAGMHEGGAAELEMAKPYDRAFIDEMVPHHRGAIRMAEVVLEDTDDAQLRRLAEAIITAQTREIGEMNDWRRRWYGALAPEGPGGGSGDDSGSTEEHGSGH